RKAAGELSERIARRLARVDEYAQRGLLAHIPALVAAGELAVPAEQNARHALLDRWAARLGPAAGAASVPELLLRPRVSTYNAFADALVREHAARIGRDPEAVLLGASGSWLLARAVVLRADDPVLSDREFTLSTLIEAVRGLAAGAL